MSRLIVFAGLPGVGKTTQARSLADALRAVYLRLDTLEAPFIRMADNNDLKDYGYQAIAHLAGDNLELGRTVIIDAVNPMHHTRAMFRELAEQHRARLIQFECVLPDEAEHRRRVEKRGTLNWDEVLAITTYYERWDEHLDGRRNIIVTG